MISPKEKAKELIERYDKAVNTITNTPLKKCALIAVSEIIEAMKKVEVRNPYNAYWHEVKNEIEKL